MGIGWRDCYPSRIHTLQIVDVVAHVGDLREIEAMLCDHAAQLRQLVVDTLAIRNAELATARANNRIDLLRQHDHWNARCLQQANAHAVAPVAQHRLATIFQYQNAVVGHHAIKIEHQQPDPAQQRFRAGLAQMSCKPLHLPPVAVLIQP
ncbi:MAG: hypothetical protein IPK78_13315 [Rhodospirillales bacterium]|nr:hypothetical protein [Rhodospirillales bacterium]